ncbi:MAG TPA: cbb3-type cytochrome c oxidase subunit I [Gaiellaceae bacterium]|nr:cbb3-type cytochrome c oxidase subunit I [Gaiellaceae bacterium]
MTAIAPSQVLHPRGAAFTPETSRAERRIGLLFAASGLALVLLMGLLGITMRLTQADVIGLSPGWFYRLLTLHGAGMITGVLLVTMGALWYALRQDVPLRAGRMLAAYWLIVTGALAVLVATLAGGFGAGWTFLPPLPFYPAGQWTTWSESLFFSGLLLVGGGFFVYCLDVLEQTTARYGGLTRALGWQFLRGRDGTPPPPQAIAATVVAIDGLLSSAVASAILTGLLGRTYDSGAGVDPLVAKNLVYFFGHSMANLAIYLAAGAVYVLVPRYAGRPYETTKAFVAGWAGSLVFIAAAYSHHLYMDFVQPTWAEAISEVASYGALVPVAVVTIYSLTMLVWGSRYRWTLASLLLYVGLAGWAIGGVGAVIDSLIPLNFRLHNTDWVVAHFHTYLILCVVLWCFAFLAHLLERDAERTTSAAGRAWTAMLILVGGYGLTGTWFLAGLLGVPRRYAIQPPGTSGYSLAGSIFALVLALGFGSLCLQLVRLAREAWERRHYVLVTHTDGWTGGTYRVRVPREDEAVPSPAPHPSVGLPLERPGELALGAALCVVGLAAFLPPVVRASEASVGYHHLDHAGHFFLGTMLGLVAGSLPVVSRRLGPRPTLGLTAVIAAPTLMMLVMIPRFYEPLEHQPAEHAAYHLAMVAFGLLTGLGASRLGRVTGRLAAFLAVGMSVMFAAAMR